MTLSLCCVTWGGLILTSYNRFLLDTDQVPTTHSLQLGLSTPETSGSRTPAGGTAGVIHSLLVLVIGRAEYAEGWRAWCLCRDRREPGALVA